MTTRTTRWSALGASAALLAAIALPASAAYATQADPTARERLDAAIAASNIAYSNGVASVLRSENGGAPSEYTAGAVGANLYSGTPSIDAIWVLEPGREIAFAGGKDSKLTLYQTVTSSGAAEIIPTWIVDKIVADVEAKGGNRDSLVSLVSDVPASSDDLKFYLLSASPAAYLEVVLDSFTTGDVTAANNATGTTFTITASFNELAPPITLIVQARPNGEIYRLDVQDANGNPEGSVTVAQVGADVILPEAVTNRIDTDSFRGGVDYWTAKAGLAADARIIKNKVAAQAARGKGKVTKKLIGKSVRKLDAADYSWTPFKKGYRITARVSVEAREFGTPCARILAVNGKAAIRSC